MTTTNEGTTRRDELASEIAGHHIGDGYYSAIVNMNEAREIADDLLAAGYRTPRTITTVEELDALAVGSVVLHHGRAFQHYPAYPAPFNEYQKWKCGDGGFVRSTKDGSAILPATVLHEPEAEATR